MSSVPIWMTCLIGIGVVFAGLLFLILICNIMSLFFKGKKVEQKETAVLTPSSSDSLSSEERGKLVAAASCAIAESLGKDVSAIRVVSFIKK